MTNNPSTGEFIPPPPGSAGVADVAALLRNTVINVDTDPQAQNQPQIIDLARLTGDKSYAGCSYVRVPFTDNRGGHAQTGKYSAVNTKRSSGALICDAPGYLRLPFLTTQLGTVSPGNVDRICSVSIFGTHVFTGYEFGLANLFRETSATDPTPIAVAGYAPPAGCSGITAIRRIMINGTPYLAICFAVGGANTVQILSDLANPPTSSTIPVGAFPTLDLIQTPIDGNALLIYKGNAAAQGTIVAMRTDVGAGAVTISAVRSTLALGGYAVGLSSWEGDAYAYWVEPVEGNFILYGGGGFAGPPGFNHGRLIRTDLRGYLASPVDVPLPWVTFASRVRGGIVVCDTQTHWNLGRKGYQHEFHRMSIFDDLVADSNHTQVCCGHHELAGRFMIEVNDTITPGGTGNTQRYTMEWDFDLWEPSQVSSAKLLGTTGVLSPGGAELPWSPVTGYLQTRANGSWWRQFQPGLGVNGFNLRHTTGAAAGTGQQFEASESLTWPVMDIDGLEDQPKLPIGVIGPKPGNVLQGGSAASVLIEELLSGTIGSPLVQGGKGALFRTTEPTERIPRQAIKNGGWTYHVQPRITVTRDQAVTDNTRLTSNAFGNGIALEFLSIKNPLMAPTMVALRAALDPQR
jgi:hypothetical protein